MLHAVIDSGGGGGGGGSWKKKLGFLLVASEA